MDELNTLGIAENTLFVAMADNGPMIHNPPPGLGMVETMFTGGKGDHTEGGVRVPAFAWWPGVIEANQIVGDIVHVTDMYTTFATYRRSNGNIFQPTASSTALTRRRLLLNGDTHSRRDYVHIYKGSGALRHDQGPVQARLDSGHTRHGNRFLFRSTERHPGEGAT